MIVKDGKFAGPDVDAFVKAMHSTQIRFYRSNGEFGFLSNLYKAEIEFEGRKFPTNEHAYQFGKFRKTDAAEWAMNAPDPHYVAIVAHGLFSWDVSEGWTAKKVDRMRQVLDAKFTQHPELKGKLLETGTKILIEESSMDNFWGIGPKGKGKNMLGVLLMEIRTKLQTE